MYIKCLTKNKYFSARVDQDMNFEAENWITGYGDY